MEVETALMLSPLELAVLRESLLERRNTLSVILDSLDARDCSRSAVKEELQVVTSLLERV